MDPLKWLSTNHCSIQMQLSLAIVLTLAFVWLYFNVNCKSDIQFNFLCKFRTSFWSSLYCCSVLFHSGLWFEDPVSLWFLLCSLLVEITDLRHECCIWNRPLPQPAALGRLRPRHVNILSLCFSSVHTRPAYSRQDLPLIGIFYMTFRYVSWDIVVIGLEVARVVSM